MVPRHWTRVRQLIASSENCFAPRRHLIVSKREAWKKKGSCGKLSLRVPKEVIPLGEPPGVVCQHLGQPGVIRHMWTLSVITLFSTAWMRGVGVLSIHAVPWYGQGIHAFGRGDMYWGRRDDCTASLWTDRSSENTTDLELLGLRPCVVSTPWRQTCSIWTCSVCQYTVLSRNVSWDENDVILQRTGEWVPPCFRM
jgi:hypothetical protein